MVTKVGRFLRKLFKKETITRTLLPPKTQDAIATSDPTPPPTAPTGGGGSSSTQSFPLPTQSFPSTPLPKQSFPLVKTITGVSRIKRKQSARNLEESLALRKLEDVRIQLRILRTQRSREELKRQPTFKTEVRILGKEAEKTALELALLPRSLRSLVKSLANKEINFRQIPSSIKRDKGKIGKFIREDPATVFLKIGTEILILKGTGEALKVTGRVTGRARTVLSPKFKGINPTSINLRSGAGGTTTIRVGGGVQKLKEPLSVQVKLAGTKVTAVSAQADRLVNLVKTKRVIRKPIPNESRLPRKTKLLLKKFDQGKINRNELIVLQDRLKQRGQSLLERSLFADPRARFRPSRLGREPKGASLLDILSGDVTFRTPKPQILVFEDVKIAKFPKTKKFNSIKKKLKANKNLTPEEARALIKFQTKVSGKFKPIGALTKEPEITLAPGEIVKREKLVGRVIIKGRPVPIVRVSVVKATKKTASLIQKSKRGTIKTREIKELERRLRKETGFKPRLSRRKLRGRKIVRQRILPRPRIRPRRKPKRRPTRRRPTPKRPRPRPRPKAARRITRRPKLRPPVRPTRRRTAARIIKPPILIPLKKKPRRKLRKPVKKKRQAYTALARPTKKRKGKKLKFIKLTKVPLSKKDARNLGSFITDKSLARTFKIRKVKGTPKKPKIKIPQNHFTRTRKKFRTFKIRKGKKIKTKNRFIERRKRLLDTKSERRGITLRRKLAQLRKKSKRKIKGGRR